MNRLNEDDAALVIRRALEIQGEPGTVTLEELRLAATELRIDPAALEQALAERLRGDGQVAPPTSPTVMPQQRTDLFRSWYSDMAAEETERALLAPSPKHDVWFAPTVSKTYLASNQRFGICPGEVVVEQHHDVTYLSAKIKWWPSVLATVLSWPLSLALLGPVFGYSLQSIFIIVVYFFTSISLSVGLGMWIRSTAVRVAKGRLDMIEQRLRGVLR